jgi:pilus assembly protein Flp/PilA
MMSFLCNFLHDRSGATAIEYGLIASGLVIAIVSAVNTLGGTVLTNLFGTIATAVSP